MKKSVLLSVLAVVVLGVVALKMLQSSQESAKRYNEVRKEGNDQGKAFGKERLERACVVESFRRYRECTYSEAELCERQERSFLIACLTQSKRDRAMCENTPIVTKGTSVTRGLKSSLPSREQMAKFEKTLCAKLPEYPEECERLAKAVVPYCRLQLSPR